MPTLTDLSTIRDLCARYDFALSKGFGQNFIINPGICPRIADEAGIGPGWGALEVGPGIGVLTEQLCKRADKVVSIEVDKRLPPLLEETMADYDNFKLVLNDVLKVNLKALLAEEFGDKPVAVCANLPYYITSPILMRLLEEKLPIENITVMVQKEAAQRLCAAPGTRDAGAISYAVAYYAEPKLLFTVQPGSFYPAPKVTSAVIRLNVRKTPAVEVPGGDEKKLLGVIKEEIIAIADKYGDDRKTEIGYDEYDMSMEDLIPETNTVITMTKVGYIKRMSTDNFKAQHRGGKGIKGMETIEDDYIVEMLMTTSHHYLMFFTNTGRVYRIKAYEIPEASRTSRGTAIINLIPLQPDEKITAMIPIKEYEDDKYLFMATRNGIVKKTPIKDYENIRKNGLAAINLREDDKLIEVKVTDNSEDILLFTKFGQCIRFKETDVRSTGRTTMGVIGMNLAPNDVIIAMQTASMGEAVLLVSSNGLGKRTRIDEFTTQNRGGKGVKCYKITEKSGNLVGVKSVENDDELMLITTEGIIIRIQVSDVTVLGRITTGVKLINLKEGVSVASIAKVVEDKTLMPPEEAKAETDESENSDEDSAENNNSHAEAIENNTEA